MVCPQTLNGIQILSFDMLKNLRRASVLVFTRPRTLNPKTLKPENLEYSESERRKHCVYAVFSAYTVFSAISLLMFDDRESSMLQSGQTTGSVRKIIKGIATILTIPILKLWIINDDTVTINCYSNLKRKVL